ncbi:hypothetical protein [Flagellimonas eckloniae]|uniref:EF-hand domain-containing protein n=1 Tax=Flagellimonas eckloniae TaxID=346185 RepID=A0A0Q1CG57_9FLAO|nr:hypothetical protein [Allomuricauda eckloniae]KQC29816.1 hypothetical protein AAY42_07925 [Allomuricauda eckloniae]
MKKIIVILSLVFVFSCNSENDETQSLISSDIESEFQQVLPDNVEGIHEIDSNNESLNAFLSSTNVNGLDLNLDEVSMIKFKGGEGKYAISIPFKSSDRHMSENLFVYFLDSDLTKFKSVIHSVETYYNDDNIEKIIVGASPFDRNLFFKREYKNDSLSSKTSNALSCQCYFPLFSIVDINGNGQISIEEFQIVDDGPISPFSCNGFNFNALDQDGDAQINQNEYPDCFSECVNCVLNSLNCSPSDTLCVLAAYADCGFNSCL